MMDTKVIDVALGKKSADMVILNGNLINVHTREVYQSDVSIVDGKIAGVGKLPEGVIGPDTQIIDAAGKYLSPGFIDAHIHFESSMLTFTEFSNTVIKRGTTAVASDIMEITIVAGLEGLKEILSEAGSLPVSLYYPVPSFMGDESEFQTTGSVLSASMIEQLLPLDEAVGLAEVLVPPILAKSPESEKVIALADKLKKTAEGHAPATFGKELNAYVSTGIRSDHESTTKEEALEKVRNGLRVLMREGSASTDLKDCLRIITEDNIDPRHLAMISDDVDALHLVSLGHMDHKIRMAVKEGVDPVAAIQMATLNPAESLKIDDLHGSISPGKMANIVLLSSIEECAVKDVVAKGSLVVKDGSLIEKSVPPTYANVLRNTVSFFREIKSSDLLIKAQDGAEEAVVHVIGASPVSLLTDSLEASLPVKDKYVACDVSQDILHIACVERYGKNGNIGKSFIKGFSLKEGALATSVGHDHHNITVVGTNEEDMLVAVNRIKELDGALVVVRDGKVVGEIPLSIAGLLSLESAEDVAKEQEHLLTELKEMGCTMASPFMSLSFITLIFIPDFAITDVGLMDVKQFKIIDPVISWR
ncbi:MAG: adenine deaminase [Sphaerochaetaceae bacterium]|nr:adenine deaminase [Sphaerochaetaceae bacterium]